MLWWDHMDNSLNLYIYFVIISFLTIPIDPLPNFPHFILGILTHESKNEKPRTLNSANNRKQAGKKDMDYQFKVLLY